MPERSTERSKTASSIMDIAEDYIRTRGYNAFSFRDISAEIGIKTASIHYHFPSKADLGVAVTQRYTERFIESLGEPDAFPVMEQVRRYKEAFRSSYAAGEQMCLCGMLGAEISSLPDNVMMKSKAFFDQNMSWLTRVFLSDKACEYSEDSAQSEALKLLALLEGGLIVARTLDGLKTFDQIIDYNPQ